MKQVWTMALSSWQDTHKVSISSIPMLEATNSCLIEFKTHSAEGKSHSVLEI